MQQQVLMVKPKQQEQVLMVKPKQQEQSKQETQTCWTTVFSYFRGLCCGCVEQTVDLR